MDIEHGQGQHADEEVQTRWGMAIKRGRASEGGGADERATWVGVRASVLSEGEGGMCLLHPACVAGC